MAAHIDRAAEHLARKLLVDTCTIHRPVETGSLDPVTLAIVDTGTEVYEGACFVNFRPGEGGGDGGQYVTVEALGRSDQRVRVRLGRDCPQLLRGDEITITATDNEQLLGATLEVLADETGSYAVSKLVRARLLRRVDRQ